MSNLSRDKEKTSFGTICPHFAALGTVYQV